MRIGSSGDTDPGSATRPRWRSSAPTPAGPTKPPGLHLDAPDPRRIRRHDGGDGDRYGHGSAIEVGTAIVPIQPGTPSRWPRPGPLDPGRLRGRFRSRARRVAPLDHPGHARPALRAPGPDHAQLPRRHGPGVGRPGSCAVDNELFTSTTRSTSPTSSRRRDRRRTRPRDAELARNGRPGPACSWRTSDHRVARRSADHQGCSGHRPAASRILAGVPVYLSATTRSTPPSSGRTTSSAKSSTRPIMSADGAQDAHAIGDVLICGSEATMEQRMRRFASAGVTDLNARIVPLGEGRDTIHASAERTRRSWPRSHHHSSGMN